MSRCRRRVFAPKNSAVRHPRTRGAPDDRLRAASAALSVMEHAIMMLSNSGAIGLGIANPSAICGPRQADVPDRGASRTALPVPSTPVRSCWRRPPSPATPQLCRHIPPHELPPRRKAGADVHPTEAISPSGASRACEATLHRSSHNATTPRLQWESRYAFPPQPDSPIG